MNMRVFFIVVLVLALALSAWAAVAFVAGDGFTNDNDVNTHTLSSFTVSSGSDRLLLLGYGDNGSEEDVDTVVFNGSEGFTLARNDGNAVEFAQSAIWYRIAPTATTANIVVTLDAADTNRAGITGISLTGVHQTTPIGDVDGANGTTTTSSSLTLTTTAGDMVISCLTVRRAGLDPGNLTLTDGGTEIEEIDSSASGALRYSCAYEAAVGASTTTAWSWTGSTGWAHSAVVVQQATAGGSPVTIQIMRKRRG